MSAPHHSNDTMAFAHANPRQHASGTVDNALHHPPVSIGLYCQPWRICGQSSVFLRRRAGGQHGIIRQRQQACSTRLLLLPRLAFCFFPGGFLPYPHHAAPFLCQTRAPSIDRTYLVHIFTPIFPLVLSFPRSKRNTMDLQARCLP